MQNTENKKNSKGVGVGIGVMMLVGALAGCSEDQDLFLALLFLAICGLVVFLIVWFVVRIARAGNGSVHTHDRIDHRQDLKIDSRTGKVVARTAVRVHTPQEHWKAQLDVLLANGTIDRAEYRQMLNRYNR